MCKFPDNWNRVKVLSYAELIVTVITLSVLEYAYIRNKQLIGGTEVPPERYEIEELEQLESSKSEETEIHKYIGRVLVVIGVCGMFGIVYFVATILTGKFGNSTPKQKDRTIACWFWLNASTIIILTCIWGGLIYFVALDDERASAGPDVQIPFGLCYFSRYVIMIGIWKIWKTLSGESEFTAVEDLEK